MPPTRLGVIGLGLIWGRVHRPHLADLRDLFEIVALCDLSPDRRAEAAAAFPDARLLSDYRELLALPEVEAVLVLTPIALNESVALDALRAGKHLLLEKPLARSVAAGAQIVALARELGRRLFVTEQIGYRRAEDALVDLLASGAIGDLVMWDRVQHRILATQPEPMNYTSTPWRVSPDFPLGNLFDGGIHLIASVTRVFGTPAAVCAAGSRKFRPGYGDFDQVSMLLRYADGLSGVLSHSDCLLEAQNHFHIHGSQGLVSWSPDRMVVQRAGAPDLVLELEAENPYTTMWRGMADAWRAGVEPAYTAERALRDLMVIEMVHQSISSGAQVSVI
jgi:scyllo-inositol 2-dehydrogenase (NADP+)